MPTPTTTFTTTIDRTIGTMIVTDTTNYAAAQVDIANDPLCAKGTVRITLNTGSGQQVIYDNLNNLLNPDIIISGTPGVMTWANPANIPYPIDTNNKPIAGEYTVTYRNVGYDIFFNLFDITTVQVYNYSLQDPEICLETVVNCSTTSLSSTDDTVYEISNGTVTSLVRQHTLYPPPASNQPVMGPANLQTLIYTPIYTTTWTAECITTVTYTLNDGLIVIVELSGVKEFSVSCDNNLNKILCCLINLQKEYEALDCKNPVKAQILKTSRLEPTLQHLVLYLAAQNTGDANKMASEYANIIEASGCSEDCGCNGTTPSIVANPNTSPSVTYVVDTLLNTVQITTVNTPTVVTYYVDVAPSIINQITNLGVTTVSTATPAYITVSQVGIAPNYNYQVNFNSSAITGVVQNVVARLALTYDNSGPGNPYYGIASTEIYVNGPDVDIFANHQVSLGQTVPNQGTDLAIITYNNFLTTYKEFVATANLMRVHNTANGIPSDIKDMECEVFWFNTSLSTGSLTLRLYNTATGAPYTLADLFSLNGTNVIYINLNITIQQ